MNLPMNTVHVQILALLTPKGQCYRLVQGVGRAGIVNAATMSATGAYA
jgi:hypothetical protein